MSWHLRVDSVERRFLCRLSEISWEQMRVMVVDRHQTPSLQDSSCHLSPCGQEHLPGVGPSRYTHTDKKPLWPPTAAAGRLWHRDSQWGTSNATEFPPKYRWGTIAEFLILPITKVSTERLGQGQKTGTMCCKKWSQVASLQDSGLLCWSLYL
jgi:hypothetical protein